MYNRRMGAVSTVVLSRILGHPSDVDPPGGPGPALIAASDLADTSRGREIPAGQACGAPAHFHKLYGNESAISGTVTTLDPLFDPAVIEEPYEYYAELRELDPVHEVPGTGTYLVSRLSLIQEVIADLVTYSSDTIKFLHVGRTGSAELWSVSSDLVQDLDVPMVLATADPPDHGRQRKVLSRLFTRSSIEARETEVRALVDELLDPHLSMGAMEWMSQAAIPLPAVVLSLCSACPTKQPSLSGTSVTRRASRSVGSRRGKMP